MRTALVTGASSGLGKEIATQLQQVGYHVVNWDMTEGVDVTRETSVVEAARLLFPPIDLLVNCAGYNHLDWFEDLTLNRWDAVMNCNARAIWMVTSALIRANCFMDRATVVNIVSNASHKPMTNSAAYNASKGAAHILTLQMARELLPRHGLTVFGISPNRLQGTGMSEGVDKMAGELRGWSLEEVGERQREAMPTGQETPPDRVAEFLGFLASTRERHECLHGTVIPYGA